MKVSEHFSDQQFGWPGGVNPDIDNLLQVFCSRILEPIVARFGLLRVTSGYRSPAHNARVGVANSFHVWSETRIAADVQLQHRRRAERPDGADLSALFDWLRLESGLPFDKIILERGKTAGSEADDCVHIQFQLHPHPRREAYQGNAWKYVAVEVRSGPQQAGTPALNEATEGGSCNGL